MKQDLGWGTIVWYIPTKTARWESSDGIALVVALDGAAEAIPSHWNPRINQSFQPSYHYLFSGRMGNDYELLGAEDAQRLVDALRAAGEPLPVSVRTSDGIIQIPPTQP